MNRQNRLDLEALEAQLQDAKELALQTGMAKQVQQKAFGYVRVSSVGQAAENRDGFKRQEAAIRAWAQAHDVRIVRWFRESMTGASNPLERPAFQRLLTAPHGDGVKLVVCEKYDRVARDSMWIEWTVRHLRDHKFSLVSACEPELADDADPHRKAKSALVLKLRAARQRAKQTQADYREGRKPYGHRPGEVEIMEDIKAMRGKGMSYEGIAAKLNAKGVAARAGRWHANSVRRVLLRVNAQ